MYIFAERLNFILTYTPLFLKQNSLSKTDYRYAYVPVQYSARLNLGLETRGIF